MATVFTVGHGTRSTDELVEVLRGAGVTRVMDSDEFISALERLARDAEAEAIVAICAETLWWRCHRQLIADASRSQASTWFT